MNEIAGGGGHAVTLGGKAGHFRRLGAPAPPLAVSDNRIAILTGQSDLSRSRLSMSQKQFLATIAPSGVDLVLAGFPFTGDDEADVPSSPLLAASLANARQYLWCLGDARYRALAAQAISRLLVSTRRDLLLVTGSCGLAIAGVALSALRPGHGARCSILALGPVGRPPPDWVGFQAVVGRRDVWSRALFRGRPHAVIDAGHMDYWSSPEAMAIAARLVRQAIAR